MTGAAWLADALVASTLLMAAVLLLRIPARRLFGARVAYALWALPALRLALPPLPAWGGEGAPVTLGRETIVVIATAAPDAVADIPAPSLAPPLLAIWAAGALLLFGWQVVRHRRFCRTILTGAEPLATIRGVRVMASPAATGPLAFGLWRRVIVVPADFGDTYDPDEGALALSHELCHHARGDLVANWIALVVLACHWFNPLARIAWRTFRIDQELAADAAVLAASAPALRHAYARAIVKAATGTVLPAACRLHNVNDLKGRLSMLSRTPASRRRLLAGGGAVAALVTAGLAATASGTPAATALADGVSDAVAQVAPPAPPAPPVPPAPVAGAKRVHRIVVSRDGRTDTYEGAQADAYLAAHPLPVPPTPPVPPAAPTTRQVRTVVVRPDGRGQSAYVIGGRSVAQGAPLPTGLRMPGDLGLPDGCTTAGAPAMVLRGEGGDAAYTVLCTRDAGTERDAYRQALASLATVRRQIATQVATPAFPEAERRRALAAVDGSIAEIESDLARLR